ALSPTTSPPCGATGTPSPTCCSASISLVIPMEEVVKDPRCSSLELRRRKRPRARPRVAKRDQAQAIEIPGFRAQETGDSRTAKADRQRFSAKAGLRREACEGRGRSYGHDSFLSKSRAAVNSSQGRTAGFSSAIHR